MESSHLARSLRITFLAVGFIISIIMVVQWVQHVSSAKPLVTPKVIATTPQAGRGTDTYAADDFHASPLASFVRVATPSPVVKKPSAVAAKTPAKLPLRQPAPSVASPKPPHPTVPDQPPKPPKPALPPAAPVKPAVTHGPYVITTPRDY